MGVHLVQVCYEFPKQNLRIKKSPSNSLLPFPQNQNIFRKKFCFLSKLFSLQEKPQVVPWFMSMLRWAAGVGVFLVMGESLPFYWRGLQLPWYWDISPLAEVEDFCVRDASGRCSPVAGARQKRRLRAGDAQLYGHSRGQFAVRSVGGFFKLTLLNFSLRILLFLIHFGMITNISS